MSDKTTKASLRIFSDERDIQFLSKAFGVIPSTQHLKGEPCSKRDLQSGAFEQSVWIYESPLPDSSELHEHLTALLELLESRESAIESIRNRITSVDIFCMFSSENGQGSAEMSADLLRRLANQRIDLIIDLYPPN
jgi:uncharacterized protein DUF4279